ncbi:MAG: Mth938-like domain-containing protein, partial [Rhodoferax sp.]|nr:Mth938-like domain-containing protein [Rhodoferax sp.]
MKLQPDKSAVQSVSAYGPGWVAIDGERYAHSLVISSSGDRFDWNCRSFAELGAAHFARLAELDAELVLFGSGTRIRFAQPAWLGALMQRRIGVETMDTQAACRTYNILAGEGRKV